MASDLAERDPSNPSAATWQADAATWSSQAADLKQRINATLFDAARGVYKLADRDNGNHAGTSVPQDANAEAITFGIAPAETRTQASCSYLKSNLWGTFGPQPYSPRRQLLDGHQPVRHRHGGRRPLRRRRHRRAHWR